MKKHERAGELLRRLEELGVVVWTEADKLKYRAPKDSLSPQLLEELKREKEGLLVYLNEGERQSDRFRLTPIQYAYLIGCSGDYELGNTNAHYYIEYEAGTIDEGKLERAINMVIAASDALRLVIVPAGYQYVREQAPAYRLEVAPVIGDEQFLGVRQQWERRFYAPGEWPMFHFRISRRPGRDILHVSFDCMVLDALSAQMMMLKIFALYRGEQPSFPAFTFRDYMQGEAAYAAAHVDAGPARAYWEEQAKLLPEAPALLYRQEFAAVRTPVFERKEHLFSREETRQLYDKAKANRCTPAAVICTAFMKVLAAYGRSPDLTLDLTLFNRLPMNKEVNEVLGDFTNIGFASYRGKRGAAFMEEAGEIQRQFWKLVQFRAYDGTRVLKQLGKEKPGKAILPVVYTCVLRGDLKDLSDPVFREVYSLSRTPQVCLDHHVRDDTGVLKLSWDYIGQLFAEDYVESMFVSYVELIERLAWEADWNKAMEVRKR